MIYALNNEYSLPVENGGNEMNLFEFLLWLCNCDKMKCQGEATTQLITCTVVHYTQM